VVYNWRCDYAGDLAGRTDNKDYVKRGCVRMNEYHESLTKWIRRTRPTIYVFCRHVSNSGMFRLISCYVIRDNKPIYLDHLIEELGLYKMDKKRDGLRVSGCGMNMGFAVVYNFSKALFPNGFRYRKNEHHRNGPSATVDGNGGHALKHQWL